MIAFWVTGALLAALALSFVVAPLLARREDCRLSRSAANLAVHRDQLRELDADRDSGTIDAGHYEKAKRELEARLLEDLRDGDAPPKPPRRGRAVAIAAALAMPLVAAALYFIVGNPHAITLGQSARQGAAHDTSAQQLEALVAQLAARMAQQPVDADGWAMLGRSYQALGRVSEAAEAYAKAAARRPGDADLLADYAHALATAQGRRLEGEPARLLARALEADPDNLKALALAGSAAFESEDYAAAVRHWQRMANLVPRDSDTARALQERISEARSLGGASARLEPPKSLGELKLIHDARGKEALGQINRLHGKEVPAKGGYVAHYEKPGAVAMLYVAQASSADQAASQIGHMSAGIKRGGTPFSDLKTSEQGGTTLYSVRGQGQDHYFFRREANVLWLAVDAPVAKQALAALFAGSESPPRAVKRSRE